MRLLKKHFTKYLPFTGTRYFKFLQTFYTFDKKVGQFTSETFSNRYTINAG